MSAPMKKRALHIGNNAGEESDRDEGSDSEDVQNYAGNEEIQVDFEGRNPIDSDFHGIKQLLQQLFLKAHVNLSDLTDLIVSQNYVGSVVKQSDVDMESDDEEGEDDSNSANDVFGVTTVINLTDKQNLECIQQLRNLLIELCQEHGTDQSNAVVNNLLSNDSQAVGLLINERFINIPAQISVPLLESLSKEMKKAKEKKLAFDFSYFILISKLYKMDKENIKKRSGQNKNPVGEDVEVLWSNPEEEIFDQEADCKFEFCVKGESDSGLSGRWLEDDVAMTPYRRILIISANKLDPLIQRIKEYTTN